MNDFIFAGLNLEKENQISTPFKKWTRAELVFHFFHFLFHIFPHVLKGGKIFTDRGRKNLLIFKGLVNM